MDPELPARPLPPVDASLVVPQLDPSISTGSSTFSAPALPLNPFENTTSDLPPLSRPTPASWSSKPSDPPSSNSTPSWSSALPPQLIPSKSQFNFPDPMASSHPAHIPTASSSTHSAPQPENNTNEAHNLTKFPSKLAKNYEYITRPVDWGPTWTRLLRALIGFEVREGFKVSLSFFAINYYSC